MRFLTEKERARYEAARELGLLDKLLQVGWAGLTAAESGRIGGRLSRRAVSTGKAGAQAPSPDMGESDSPER